jgi:hypothetical protein
MLCALPPWSHAESLYEVTLHGLEKAPQTHADRWAHTSAKNELAEQIKKLVPLLSAIDRDRVDPRTSKKKDGKGFTKPRIFTCSICSLHVLLMFWSHRFTCC